MAGYTPAHFEKDNFNIHYHECHDRVPDSWQPRNIEGPVNGPRCDKPMNRYMHAVSFPVGTGCTQGAETPFMGLLFVFIFLILVYSQCRKS